MESSSPMLQGSEPPPHRWAKLLGTFMALVTLTLPLSAIAVYSSSNRVTVPSPPSYTVSPPHR